MILDSKLVLIVALILNFLVEDLAGQNGGPQSSCKCSSNRCNSCGDPLDNTECVSDYQVGTFRKERYSLISFTS